MRALLLASLLFASCATPTDDSVIMSAIVASPPPPPPTCTPAPPINKNLCNPQEPAPPPPPIAGTCTVEIYADSVAFTVGQGFTEGSAEGSVAFTATDLKTGTVTNGSFPSSDPWVKMTVGAEQIAHVALGSYEVDQGKTRRVQVCATFTEHDDFLNGKNDVGTDCSTIVLSCPQGSDNEPLAADLCKGGDCAHLNGAMSANIHVVTADADRDCVPNADDYTPEPCDEALKGQLCRGSVVFYHYGNGPLVSLVQSLGTDLRPAMTGYDRVVLLIDDAQIGPFNLDPAAIALADVVMPPTEANFFAALQDMTSRGCDMDVWMFSHGAVEWTIQPDLSVLNTGGWVTALDDDEHQADPTQDPDITTDELAADTAPEHSGTPSVPVRMTYGVPCFYQLWNQTWLNLGAKVTMGAIDDNFLPNFYDRFATAWGAGQTYGAAFAGEPSAAAENLAFGFIEAQGMAPPYLCVGNTVLGKNACAANFFIDSDLQPMVDSHNNFIDGPDTAMYQIGGPLAAGVPYNTALSGAANMRASSAKVLVGDSTITKFSALTWR